MSLGTWKRRNFASSRPQFQPCCPFSFYLVMIHTIHSENPIIEEASDDLDLVLRNACRAALKKGLVSDPDDLLVVTAGLPFGTPGAANVVRIIPAAGPSCWDGVCRAD
jgi:Pyruvate kinase, alpha/beta domain